MGIVLPFRRPDQHTIDQRASAKAARVAGAKLCIARANAGAAGSSRAEILQVFAEESRRGRRVR